MLYDIVLYLYILLPVSLEVPLSPGRDCEGTIVARVIVAGREAQGLRAAVRCLNNGMSLDAFEAAALRVLQWTGAVSVTVSCGILPGKLTRRPFH